MSIQDGTVTWEKRKVANTDNLSMPAMAKIDIALTDAGGQTFIAPSDGYYFFSGQNSTGSSQYIEIASTNTAIATNVFVENGRTFYGFVPISKGQSCRISCHPANSFANITGKGGRFIPAKSAL